MDAGARSVFARDECARDFCRRRCAAWIGEARGIRGGRGFGSGAVHPPVLEQGIGIMIEKSELLRIPTFESLPDDQLDWFIGESTEVVLKAGDTFLQQGTPAAWMFVILEGQMQMRGALGGEAVSVSIEPGEITGLLPFSRMKVAVLSGRAAS